MRVKDTLRCSECKQRNYNTMKNKKNDPDRLEMKKYCRFCRKHTTHNETKKGGSHFMAEVKKENWFKRTWGRTAKYFRELRSELKKVVWPTYQQVLKNAAIVVGGGICGGVFIWLFDFVAQIGIDALISVFH